MTEELRNFTSSPAEVSPQGADLEHISVCLCTYQRPKLLANLLDRLTRQQTRQKFSYSIIVVDNDCEQSAKEVVLRYMSLDVEVEYFCQPEKGLTYARNKSLEHSSGDYIAILDDDEVPASDWLLQLFTTLNDYKGDAVFGSVIPEFEVTPPDWILRRKFFYWRDMRSENGTETDKCVTNNALIRRDLILEYDLKFDHDYAFAGGEDQAFFYKLIDHKPDVKMLNCKDAVVYEFMTADRCKPDYILKRNLLEGGGRVLTTEKFSKSPLQRRIKLAKRFLQSYFTVISISIALPFLFLFNKDLGAEYYYKSYYHIGLLLAMFNFSPYEDRQSIGLH